MKLDRHGIERNLTSLRLSKGKRIVLYFEALMGKSEFWLNEKKIKLHRGGYLPVVMDITDDLQDGVNLIAVRLDNSDDPTYPPGKPQGLLDFTYLDRPG